MGCSSAVESFSAFSATKFSDQILHGEKNLEMFCLGHDVGLARAGARSRPGCICDQLRDSSSTLGLGSAGPSQAERREVAASIIDRRADGSHTTLSQTGGRSSAEDRSAGASQAERREVAASIIDR